MDARCFEAVPNFSEGRDAALIAELGAGRDVLDVHSDPEHNRCVVTLAAVEPSELLEVLLAKAALAVERIDLRRQSGLHPRLGAADVMPVVPLGTATMAAAEELARRLGERLWADLRVPVYYYGSLAGGRRLADLRRGRGGEPDLGDTPHPSAGAVCVGARPPLVAYNLAFAGFSLDQARRLAAEMRRLPGVQALAFPLRDGRAQLSLNLTRPGELGAAAAYEAAGALARKMTGGGAGPTAPPTPELVGLCPATAAGPGCQGALLEGRLAAFAARLGAGACRAKGGDEALRLAARLEGEAASLAALGVAPDDLLGGAERAEALRRVLGAGGAPAGPASDLLRLAARGLRAAVAPEPRYADRLRLLDVWLGEG